jgi:hypothetical protein
MFWKSCQACQHTDFMILIIVRRSVCGLPKELGTSIARLRSNLHGSLTKVSIHSYGCLARLAAELGVWCCIPFEMAPRCSTKYAEDYGKTLLYEALSQKSILV